MMATQKEDTPKNQREGKPQLKLVVQRASQIKPENTRWLWQDQIPLGKLTLIAGDPKIGKSQITADLAASVALGRKMPDGENCAQGAVLMLSAEDDARDTIIPRLMSAGLTGADLEWVDILDGLEDASGKQSCFDFVAGYEALEAYARGNEDLRLVIIDPVMAYMGRRDAHKAAEVRDALMPYIKLAADHGFAIVAVTHLNRGSSASAFDRVLGSGAFAQLARMCFLVTRDEEEERCLFTPFGGNLAPLGDAYAYTIESASVASGDVIIKTSRVRWQKERIPITAEEALNRSNDARQGGRSGPNKQEQARELILTALAARGGRMLSDELKTMVEASGISGATYRIAANRLREKEKKIRAEKEPGLHAPWWTVLTP